ncbi:MAG: TlpA family protein disulfide reductase [Rhodocyclales bacterium]|nr:TlpA family protein disulfide reductase [Rhodocyclales bacterium]
MFALRTLLVVIAVSLSTPAAMADPEVGRTLKHVDIRLLGGESLAATELAGKPVAYVFWATWCHVCRHELPVYQKLQNAHGARGLRVIALSLDESESAVKAFWRDAGYSLPVAMRTTALRAALGGIRGTPTLYLVDRDGRLVEKLLGEIDPDQLDAMIRKLL